MSNFEFLSQNKEYALFASAAIEALLPCVPPDAGRRWSWR